MKLNHIRYVTEIAESGSISQAAERLFISQPFLSLQITELEKELGKPLFIRSNKGVSLTLFGETFIKHGERILELVENIYLEAENFRIVKRGTLNIVSIYSYTMLDLFQNFLNSLEESEAENVTYEEIRNIRIPSRITSEDAQIGFMYFSKQIEASFRQEFKQNNLQFKSLIKEQPHIAVGYRHPLAKKTSVTLDETKKFPLLLEKTEGSPETKGYRENNPFPDWFKDHIRNTTIFYNNRSLLHFLCNSTDSFTIGQKVLNLSSPYVTDGKIVYIPIEDKKDSVVDIGCIYSGSSPIQPLMKVFIKFLEIFFYSYSNMSDSSDAIQSLLKLEYFQLDK